MERNIAKECYEERYRNQKYEDGQLFKTFKPVVDRIIEETRKKDIETFNKIINDKFSPLSDIINFQPKLSKEQFLKWINDYRKHLLDYLKNKIKEEYGLNAKKEVKGCGKKEYIETNNGKGRTLAVCGCLNGWLCNECRLNAKGEQNE